MGPPANLINIKSLIKGIHMLIATLPQPVWSDMIKAGRPFIKMHGLKNHFIIVDGRNDPYTPPADAIVEICDVKRGIGADQLLVIEHPSEKGIKVNAYARMRIYNIDGSEAETCGNATRCLAKLLLKESSLQNLVIETKGGNLHCWRNEDADLISVFMGKVTTDWKSIPLAKPCDTMNVEINCGPLKSAVALNIGNPHLVFFVDELKCINLSLYGPQVQSHTLLPESANVGVAQIIDNSNIFLTVFERPGILTMACGSGACCAVSAARALGLIKSNTVTVHMPGGPIIIEQDDDGSLIMTGAAEFSFSGRLSEA
jgi:diaminopimelate epimerase